jgi:hypothetical protein
MLPLVTHVFSVEMIRDGGSLAAIYRGDNSAEYWLFFPVRTEPVDSDHTRIAGWELPEIRERGTGLKSGLSWDQAKTFIGRLKPHVHDPREIAILDAMGDIATAGGSIPPSVKAVYPSIGQPGRTIVKWQRHSS